MSDDEKEASVRKHTLEMMACLTEDIGARDLSREEAVEVCLNLSSSIICGVIDTLDLPISDQRIALDKLMHSVRDSILMELEVAAL